MKEFYSVYRFKDDFILLATFTTKADADAYHASEIKKGTPNLYSTVVIHSLGSLMVSLSPFGDNPNLGLLIDFIDKSAA